MGRYIDSETSEEYSVGLMAFNEAIDKFDSDKNGNFISYCNIVINHRIIDHIRKNKRENKAIPFSYFEEKANLKRDILYRIPIISMRKLKLKKKL